MSRRHTRELRDRLLRPATGRASGTATGRRDERRRRARSRPQRVRVTSPRRDATVRGPVRPLAGEIDERTALGEVYMAALMRAQLRLGAAVLAAAAVLLGGLPLLFLAVPAASDLRVRQVPLPWLAAGRRWSTRWSSSPPGYYVRHAERIERDFADLVGAGGERDLRRRRRSPWSAW